MTNYRLAIAGLSLLLGIAITAITAFVTMDWRWLILTAIMFFIFAGRQ